jgi:5-oxoprolinase (ATP-hydrolysing)
LSPSVLPKLKSRLDKLSADVKAQLIEQGFTEDRIKFERMLNMRFDGTDTAIMVLEKEGQGESSFEEEFKKQYKSEFGFLLEEKNIIIDDVKVCTPSIRFIRSSSPRANN